MKNNWNKLSILAQGHFLSFYHYNIRDDIEPDLLNDCPCSYEYGPSEIKSNNIGTNIISIIVKKKKHCRKTCGILFPDMDVFHYCPCHYYGCEQAFEMLTKIIKGRNDNG